MGILLSTFLYTTLIAMFYTDICIHIYTYTDTDIFITININNIIIGSSSSNSSSSSSSSFYELILKYFSGTPQKLPMLLKRYIIVL